MAKMTRAQREWKPGQRKKAASIKQMFASTVLSLEALVAFFGTLGTFGSHFSSATGIKVLIWVVGLALALACLAAPAFLKKPWGYTFGWVLQVLLILSGLVYFPMLFIGVAFALAYWYSMSAGEKMDRENARREQEQLEWERNNPA